MQIDEAPPTSDEGRSARAHTWTHEELERIAGAEELDLAPVKGDGTLRNPMTMWVVRHRDALDGRSVDARGTSWCRGARARHEAHIRVGGGDGDGRLVETDEVDDALDDAYRAKDRRDAKGTVGSILSPQARAATRKLVPR